MVRQGGTGLIPPKITVTEAKKIVKMSFLRKVPLFMWGSPGIGKSSIVRQVVDELNEELKPHAEALIETISVPTAMMFKRMVESSQRGMKGQEESDDESPPLPSDPESTKRYFEDHLKKTGRLVGYVEVRLSQVELPDVRAFPILTSRKMIGVFPAFLSAPWKYKEPFGILCVDDMNLVPPAVQEAACQLILDRKTGVHEIPPGWAAIAVGTRTTDHDMAEFLERPYADQFMHVELLPPSIDSWEQWAVEHGIDSIVISVIRRLAQEHLQSTDEEKGTVVEPLLVLPDNEEIFQGKMAFPTPRSWELASRLLKGAYVKKLLQKEDLSDEERSRLQRLLLAIPSEADSTNDISFSLVDLDKEIEDIDLTVFNLEKGSDDYKKLKTLIGSAVGTEYAERFLSVLLDLLQDASSANNEKNAN